MKTIKFLMVAAIAIIAGASLTACSSDDDTADNKARYQSIVDGQVKAQKEASKKSNALLLVAFGSTWQNAFEDFDETIAAYKKAFPNHDVYFSFSSAICRNRAAAGEHKDEGAELRNYYAPDIWLEALGRVEYQDITVQSLQVIPGEEYATVVGCLKGFANNTNNDLRNEYLKNVRLHLGTPLMAVGSDDVTKDNDVTRLATELDKLFKQYAAQGAMLFMGHGNPDDYDTYKANVRYTQLENALQTINKHYFVGTVDMADNFKTNVLERMQAAGFTSGKVFCAPLMSIAGDHANNDMAGDDAEWKLNDENGEYEETSWKVFFSEKEKVNNGYDCTDETMIVKGLLAYPTIRQLWINHTTEAVNSEPLEWYHSNDGTE